MASPRNLCPDTRDQTPRNLVGRLSVSFRRCAPAVRIVEVRRDQDRPMVFTTVAVESPLLTPQPLSPFQFRLPPPLV
jgi:hypothetical protein